LVCSSGSVACLKVPQLLTQLQESQPGCEVKLVVTEHAKHFLPPLDTLLVNVLQDQDEWSQWSVRGDRVLHIWLRDWADMCIVAPLSANSLAKLATGMADNLLTCVLRAWPFSRGKVAKPVLAAPAMNTAMWLHPVTNSHVTTLKDWGVHIENPVSKVLMCGQEGVGAMASPETIASSALALINT